MSAVPWYDRAQLPKYEHPPVAEAAVAVEFTPIVGMTSFQLARLQSRWEDRYPDLEEVMGAPPTPQYTDGVPITMEFDFASFPRRIWAQGRGDGRLVQTQNDRIVLNWRKPFSDGPYPGYATLAAEFEQLWADYSAFLSQAGLPEPAARLVEYTYVNGVPLAQGEVAEDVVNLIQRGVGLRGVETFTRFQFIRDVHKSDDDPFEAQVHIFGEPQPIEGGRQLLFTVTARVVLADSSEREAGLEFAHALGTTSFAAIVTPGKTKDWGKL